MKFLQLFITKLNRLPVLHVMHILTIDVHVLAWGSSLLTAKVTNLWPISLQECSNFNLGLQRNHHEAGCLRAWAHTHWGPHGGIKSGIAGCWCHRFSTSKIWFLTSGCSSLSMWASSWEVYTNLKILYIYIYVPCSCAHNLHALNLWKHGKCHISPARQRQNHHKSHLQLRPAGNGPGNQGWILYIYMYFCWYRFD